MLLQVLVLLMLVLDRPFVGVRVQVLVLGASVRACAGLAFAWGMLLVVRVLVLVLDRRFLRACWWRCRCGCWCGMDGHKGKSCVKAIHASVDIVSLP